MSFTEPSPHDGDTGAAVLVETDRDGTQLYVLCMMALTPFTEPSPHASGTASETAETITICPLPDGLSFQDSYSQSQPSVRGRRLVSLGCWQEWWGRAATLNQAILNAPEMQFCSNLSLCVCVVMCDYVITSFLYFGSCI